MAITARELVFYVRAEDQASRVVKRVAKSFGSLSTIRGLEAKALQQKIVNTRALDRAQQAIRRNETALARAQVQASRLTRLSTAGKSLSGYTPQETAALAAAAEKNVATLQQQQKLLADDLDEVRKSGLRASAALDTQISQAKINRLRSYATEVSNLGRALRLIGVIGIAAFGFAAHAAAQFSTQATLAATQSTVATQNTTAQVLRNSEEIQKAILKLEGSGKVTAKLPEQTGAAYQIFSGITLTGNQTQQLQKGISLLKEFNKVATANYGVVTLQDVTRAGIALINRFNLSVGQVPAVMNRMQAAVRFGALNMAQFIQGLNQVAPAFNAAGYSIDQMDASMAFISRKFPNVAQGFTGLARLTETLANPKILQGLKDQGITITDTTGHLKPLDQIVSLILTKWPRLAKGGVDLQNFFKNIGGLQSTVQSRRAFVSIAQDLGGYRQMIKDVTGDNNELSKSWEAMQKSPQVNWTEFTNKLQTLVYEIGIYAIPAFTTLGKPVANLIKWFDGLSDSTKHLIATVGVFGSAGAVLVGTLLIIGGSIARLILTFKELRLLSISSEAGFLGAGAALRLGLVGALIIGIPLLVKYHTEIGNVINALGGLSHVLEALSILVAAFTLRKILLGLTNIAAEASTARYAVALLAGELAALEVIGPIAIVVGVSFILQPSATKLINKVLAKTLGTSHTPDKMGYVQAVKTANEAYQDHLYSSQDKALKAVLTDAQYKKYEKEHTPKFTQTSTYNNFLKSARNAQNAQRQATLDALREHQRRNLGINTTKPFSSGLVGFDVNTAIANVEKLRAATLKPGASIATFRKYEDALAALRKHYTGNALTALDDYLNAIESKEKKSNSKRLSAAKKAAADNLKALKDAQANVMSMYDSLLQQNQSVMGQLFQGPYSQSPSVQDRLQFGGVLNSGDILKDLQSQNTQFTNFYNTINKLKRRGAPNELIQQLIQAGPQALPAIKALSGMGDSQWKVYIKTFNRGQKLLHDQTVSQLESQLKDYRKYGEKIALQIISGMRDKRLGLANEIQSIIKKMFGVNTPVVTKATTKKIADASKAAATKPHTRTKSTYTGSKTNTHPVVGTGVRTTQSARGNTYEYNYHVVAPTSEHASVETQLRHAEFASRTKYKGNS